MPESSSNQATKAAQEKAAEAKAAQEKAIKAAQSGAPSKKHLPEEKERHLFHVLMEKRVFDPGTGKKLSKDFVQMYSAKEWASVEIVQKSLGFTCTVLWNPMRY